MKAPRRRDLELKTLIHGNTEMQGDEAPEHIETETQSRKTQTHSDAETQKRGDTQPQ